MRRYLVLLALLSICMANINELVLPVTSDVHQKLSLSLEKLAEDLSYFRTPYENKTTLYKRVAITEQYLQEASNQLYQYDNVIIGTDNQVDGNKNVIVGSYNDIKGSNNFVFIEKFTGKANGDLLIGKWRVEIDKKKLILVNASLAISFINENENRKYLRYLTKSSNRAFSYGSTTSENTFMVIQEDEGFDSAPNTQNTQTNQYQNTQNTQQQHVNEQQAQANQGFTATRSSEPVFQYSTSSGYQNPRYGDSSNIRDLINRGSIFTSSGINSYQEPSNQYSSDQGHFSAQGGSGGSDYRNADGSLVSPSFGSSASGSSNSQSSSYYTNNVAPRYYSTKNDEEQIGDRSTNAGSVDSGVSDSYNLRQQWPTHSTPSPQPVSSPTVGPNPHNVRVRSNLSSRYLRTGGSSTGSTFGTNGFQNSASTGTSGSPPQIHSGGFAGSASFGGSSSFGSPSRFGSSTGFGGSSSGFGGSSSTVSSSYSNPSFSRSSSLHSSSHIQSSSPIQQSSFTSHQSPPVTSRQYFNEGHYVINNMGSRY